MISLHEIIYGLLIAGFAGGTISLLRNLRVVTMVPRSKHEGAPARCSVLIAARNEEERLEGTIRQLFAQENISLEIIVVNDRSTDQTSVILKRLQCEFPTLKAIQVEALPPHWLGKCHALHLASKEATGEWLLFTDADCWMCSDLIARALNAAHSESADHVTIAPNIACKKMRVRGWFLLFVLSLSGWMAGVNRNRRGSHVGIGAFNLVRAEA